MKNATVTKKMQPSNATIHENSTGICPLPKKVSYQWGGEILKAEAILKFDSWHLQNERTQEASDGKEWIWDGDPRAATHWTILGQVDQQSELVTKADLGEHSWFGCTGHRAFETPFLSERSGGGAILS